VDSPPFQIHSEADAGEGRLSLSGELDLATAPRVEQAAEELLAGGLHTLVLDLSDLRFIDSSGLRVVVILHRRAEDEGWRLSIVRPSEQVHRVFEISGLADRLNFIEDRRGL